MTYEEAIDKIKKLQALATSDNPHEAALAAARAQEIMTCYSIDAAALIESDPAAAAEQNEEIEDFTKSDPLDRNEGKTQFPRWRSSLGYTLAEVNGAKVYISRGALGILGKASAVQTVRYMYAWLTREVERLTVANCRGNGRTYANNFRLGVVETINRKLREARRAAVDASRAVATGAALVRVDNALARIAADAKAVEAWADEHLNLRKVASRSNYNANARDAGKRAGESINIGARPALGAGQRALR